MYWTFAAIVEVLCWQ